MKILITGGAGFIGQHLARFLLERNVSLTILDNFLPQVHGNAAQLPADLAARVRLVRGDVADPVAMQDALQGVERIVHLAAETGTGQSMYEVGRYARTNLEGTAYIFDVLAKTPNRKLDRIVVASSRAIYGEGAYQCEQDGLVYPQPRSSAAKQEGSFDPLCPVCKRACATAATPESAPAQPSSFYGLTKLTQEQMVLLFGQVLGIPSVALRYQNVFGPGQSLQNPYTGILAIFSNLARVGQQIRVFEDGMESRDFVYIDDVVAATATALLAPMEGCHSINVGSGERTTVLEVAEQINAYFGSRSTVQVTGAFREGDIRHGLADLTSARELLGYRPAWGFADGLKRFLAWAEQSSPSTEGYERSLGEMRDRGLLRD
uniref:NAD-dependent epimerase/dehydratase n=1 Tax=mine drainage metagenome TaxID=410659 RepID=E6QLI9_9ZZZZ